MSENSPNPKLNESDLLEFALRLATYPNDPSTQMHNSYQANFLTSSQLKFRFLRIVVYSVA